MKHEYICNVLHTISARFPRRLLIIYKVSFFIEPVKRTVASQRAVEAFDIYTSPSTQ